MRRSSVRQLSVMGYANGFTLWHYRARGPDQERANDAPSTVAECRAPGFFANVAELLQPGDLLLITATDGATMVEMLEGGETRSTVP